MSSRNLFLLVSPFLLVEVLLSFVLPANLSVAIGSITKIEHLVFEKTPPPIVTTSEKIYFLGDLMLARNVERRVKTDGLRHALANFASLWSNAYVVANFEAAIPEQHVPTPDFTFGFSVKREMLPALQAAGITHVSLANNHSFDFGSVGYKNTVLELNSSNLAPFGHPYEIATSSFRSIKTGDKTVTLIGINLTSNLTDLRQLDAIMDELTVDSDLQIAYIHWGEEYNQKQSLAQKEIVLKLSQMGIDVVIGHHPHVIQGIERINKTLVFYSLGNFLFDQYFSEEVQLGLMLALDLKSDGAHFELIPVSSLESRARPYVAGVLERIKVLSNIAMSSDEVLREDILQGKLIVPWTLATSTEVAIMTE